MVGEVDERLRLSGCGHTPKSTVTPVQSAMARPLSAGTGTFSSSGSAAASSTTSSSSRICSLRVVTVLAAAAGVAHARPPAVPLS